MGKNKHIFFIQITNYTVYCQLAITELGTFFLSIDITYYINNNIYYIKKKKK
jgi:hypothetical protein